MDDYLTSEYATYTDEELLSLLWGGGLTPAAAEVARRELLARDIDPSGTRPSAETSLRSRQEKWPAIDLLRTGAGALLRFMVTSVSAGESLWRVLLLGGAIGAVVHEAVLRLVRLWNWPRQGTTADYEEDHRVPLCIGGHPRTTKNLWPQPRGGTRHVAAKDQLGISVCRAVCMGDTTLEDGQAILLAPDWGLGRPVVAMHGMAQRSHERGYSVLGQA